MTKYWIDPEMKLRANEKGWPEELAFVNDVELNGASTVGFEYDEYNKAMITAKEESLIVEGYEVNPAWEHAKPDSFVDLDIEVEFIRQWMSCVGWADCESGSYEGEETRTICRAKRTENAMPESAVVGSGMYFPERQIADLTAKLEAANNRIAQLESQLQLSEYANKKAMEVLTGSVNPEV